MASQLWEEMQRQGNRIRWDIQRATNKPRILSQAIAEKEQLCRLVAAHLRDRAKGTNFAVPTVTDLMKSPVLYLILAIGNDNAPEFMELVNCKWSAPGRAVNPDPILRLPGEE